MIPNTWLLEQEIHWAGDDFELMLYILASYQPVIMQWLDHQHVKSNPWAIRLLGRIARVYHRVGINWRHIPEHPLAALPKRLAGLFPSLKEIYG